MNKYRKDSQEWIDLLKKNNLSITNEEKFKWYIDNYSFFNLVKRYSVPFYLNEDIERAFYNKNSTSQMIIDLFNLDRKLSALILSDILSIEKKLSTLICKEIIDSNSDNISDLKINFFYDLKKEDFYNIFPKIKDRVIEETDKIEYLKNRLFKNEKSKKKYIWECFLEFNFGQICEIFSYLSTDSKKRIIASFAKFKNMTSFHFEFQKMIELLNYVRNMICHNHPIYNIRHKKYRNYEKNEKSIISLYIKIFSKEISKIKLFDIINIVVCICPHKTDLYNLAKDRFDKLFSDHKENFSQNIKKIINY